MYPALQIYCDALPNNFNEIPVGRKIILQKITQYIHDKRKSDKTIKLVYICTHNSRRSHFGQIWAQVAASYYHISNIETYSGGTEATAFNSNAIKALKRIGFVISPFSKEENSIYHISYDESKPTVNCFSKTVNDPSNPNNKFAAIMTCSNAEENCPFVPGAELRIGTTYEDPKAFDNTHLQNEKYDEYCRQIALETFYVFSKI